MIITTTIIRTTLEELGLKADVDFGPEVGNFGYRHEDVVAAFKAYGYKPVARTEDLFREVFSGFRGYIPDENFFVAEKPGCPLVDGCSELRDDRYLFRHGGWAPKIVWLLEKS
jgi:hypothetical protein